jgi:hypothetical protein
MIPPGRDLDDREPRSGQPAEPGLSFNWESGALSYNLDGEGALIRLTPDDALMLARWLLEYAKRFDGPAAQVIDLARWRSGEPTSA